MRYGKVFAIMTVVCVVACAAAYAQDSTESVEAIPGPGDAVAAAEAARAVISQPKDQSIYGEVRAVDVAANSMTVQYYDYDTDEEKSIVLSLGADARIENASGLGSIRKGDWADITYLEQNGKNMAKSIIVEKEEEIPAETAPEGEMTE